MINRKRLFREASRNKEKQENTAFMYAMYRIKTYFFALKPIADQGKNESRRCQGNSSLIYRHRIRTVSNRKGEIVRKVLEQREYRIKAIHGIYVILAA